jgi:tetratricopeptide (TPR) repeat protein
VGKILYLLARLKYREGQYNDGDQFLNEAVAIYENIGDVRLYALCLDLKARGLFTLGQREKATSVFELALAAVEKADDYKEQVKFLKKLGHIFLKESDLEKAKDYFDQAVVTSLRHGLLEQVRNIANKNRRQPFARVTLKSKCKRLKCSKVFEGIPLHVVTAARRLRS